MITLAEFADIELEEGDFRVRIGSEVHCQVRDVSSRNLDEVFTNISDVNRFPTVGFNPIANPFTDKRPVVPSAVAEGTNDHDPVFVVVDLLGCDLSPGFVAVLVRIAGQSITDDGDPSRKYLERRGWDSNPRGCYPYTISSRARSTGLCHLSTRPQAPPKFKGQ